LAPLVSPPFSLASGSLARAGSHCAVFFSAVGLLFFPRIIPPSGASRTRRDSFLDRPSFLFSAVRVIAPPPGERHQIPLSRGSPLARLLIMCPLSGAFVLDEDFSPLPERSQGPLSFRRCLPDQYSGMIFLPLLDCVASLLCRRIHRIPFPRPAPFLLVAKDVFLFPTGRFALSFEFFPDRL